MRCDDNCCRGVLVESLDGSVAVLHHKLVSASRENVGDVDQYPIERLTAFHVQRTRVQHRS